MLDSGTLCKHARFKNSSFDLHLVWYLGVVTAHVVRVCIHWVYWVSVSLSLPLPACIFFQRFTSSIYHVCCVSSHCSSFLYFFLSITFTVFLLFLFPSTSPLAFPVILSPFNPVPTPSALHYFFRLRFLPLTLWTCTYFSFFSLLCFLLSSTPSSSIPILDVLPGAG